MEMLRSGPPGSPIPVNTGETGLTQSLTTAIGTQFKLCHFGIGTSDVQAFLSELDLLQLPKSTAEDTVP